VPLCPPQIPWPDSGHHGGKPAANHLSYGTASYECNYMFLFTQEKCTVMNVWHV
jgi:hypothetical protein